MLLALGFIRIQSQARIRFFLQMSDLDSVKMDRLHQLWKEPCKCRDILIVKKRFMAEYTERNEGQYFKINK
jgi:hypothetical protein